MNNLERIKQAGIKRVRVLGPGAGNYCCAACSILVDNEFPIVNAPNLPPPDCKCEGGSKLMYIAVEEKPAPQPVSVVAKEPDLADKLQSVGCFLTIFVTIPILIIVFLLFL